MKVELDDTTPGHHPVKVVGTDKHWMIEINGEGMNLASVGTAAALYRTLGKVLNAMGELA